MAELTSPNAADAPWLRAVWPNLRALHARGAHAVLLHGAAGLGKKLLALEYAAALLCENPAPEDRACGECAGCRLRAAGSHPDLRVVVPDHLASLRPAATATDQEAEDAAPPEDGTADRKEKRVSREVRIEQVRALLDFVNVATHRGGLRVIVLAPAESLNAAAANALLKMLEEPPARTFFVLASDALDRVLPTIRSRCVLLRVAGPTWAEALAWLAGHGVADAAERLVATGGAPWPAAVEEGAERLDAAARTLLLDLLGQGPRLSAADVAARAPKTIDIGAALALMQRWAWDLAVLRSGGRVRYHPSQSALLARLAAVLAPAALFVWQASLDRQRRNADHPLNAKLVLETALLSYLDLWRAVPAGAE